MADDPNDPFAPNRMTAENEADPFAPPAEPKSDVGLLESFGRGAAEGATFGFDDKLGFDKARREASRKANPWTHFMGEMVGAIAPMALATPLAAARGAGLLARGARAVAAPLTLGETNTLAQGVAQGAKLGASYGALSGAGHADVKEDDTLGEAALKRVGSGITGGAVGAALGVPLGAAGHGVSRLAQRIGGARAAAAAETEDAGQGALIAFARGLERDRLTPDDMMAHIRAEFPDDTLLGGGNRYWGASNNRQPWTQEMIEEVVRMQAAGLNAPAITRALQVNGQGPGIASVRTLLTELAERNIGPVNLVDRAAMIRTGSGQNTQMQMRAAAATPGEATSIARENLLERQLGANARIQQLTDRLIGSTDYEGVVTRHADDLASAGSRAYGAAFANEQPFNLAPLFMATEAQFNRMRGVIPDTMRQRLNAMLWTETMADGRTVRVPPQDLQSFMYAREGLRDLIQELPQGNNLRRHLTRFYDDMTNEVSRTNPLWAEANQLWRDGKAAQDALEAGARMSMRINSKSREGMAEFTQARTAARQATEQVAEARTALREAQARPGLTPERQATLETAVETAQARLEAANARQQLFRVGLVRSISDMLANKSETANLTRELMLPGARRMLTEVLGEDDAAMLFRALQAEAAMQRTYQSQFGSQTTPLREAIDDLNWAPRFEASWSNLGIGKVLQLASEFAARHLNNARNQQLMRMYTETDPIRQMQTLRALQGVQQARSNAQQVIGTPAQSLPAPVADAVMSLRGEPASALPPPYEPPRRARPKPQGPQG